MFTSQIEITGTNNLLKAYYTALDPEKDFKNERGSYTLKLGKNKLTIKITAKDATAFRAITTSLTGLISIVNTTKKVINNGTRT